MNDPTATNSEMGTLNPTMDAKTFAESAAAQKPLITSDETMTNGIGAMTNQRWETLGKQLVELKVIDKAPAASECFTELKR